MTVGTLTAPAPLPCPAAWPRQDVPGFPRRDRCLIMGIVNVTPDSFSDGGTHLAAASAIQHGLALARSGADIIDVGGESTRPGASRVAAAEELRRVLPVIRELSAAGLTVTIDTTRSLVAEAALAAGTTGINDVSGGLADPAMARLAAEAHVPYIAMHWRGLSRDMQQRAVYADVVTEVTAELRSRLESLLQAGIDRQQLVLDPGLGFAKRPAHDWQLLNRSPNYGRWASRCSSERPARHSWAPCCVRVATPQRRPRGTWQPLAVSALAAAAGAYCVRVHDITATLDAVRVAAEWTAPHSDPARQKES